MANTKIIFPLATLADFFVIIVIVFLVMYISIIIMNVVMCIRLLIVYIRIAAATRHI